MSGLTIVADRRLWLDVAKTRVVEDGDPAAAFLYVAEGDEINASDAGRFGLAVEDGKVILLREPDEAAEEGAGGEAGGSGDDANDAGEGAGDGAGDDAGAESETEEEPAKPAAPKKSTAKGKKK